jgi:hypothetical protein
MYQATLNTGLSQNDNEMNLKKIKVSKKPLSSSSATKVSKMICAHCDTLSYISNWPSDATTSPSSKDKSLLKPGYVY